MSRPPRDDHGYHALVEHYTPDGTLGRLLFGLFVGGTAGTALIGGIGGLLIGELGAFLLGTLGVVFGLAGVAVTLAALWPVYLSLIGNLENPETYPVGEGLETPEADPAAILQRRYADGEISRETFERRLDDVLAADAGRHRSGDDRSVDGRRGTRDDEPGATRDGGSTAVRDDAPGERVTAADAPETDELRAARERARSRRANDEHGRDERDGREHDSDSRVESDPAREA